MNARLLSPCVDQNTARPCKQHYVTDPQGFMGRGPPNPIWFHFPFLCFVCLTCKIANFFRLMFDLNEFNIYKHSMKHTKRLSIRNICVSAVMPFLFCLMVAAFSVHLKRFHLNTRSSFFSFLFAIRHLYKRVVRRLPDK